MAADRQAGQRLDLWCGAPHKIVPICKGTRVSREEKVQNKQIEGSYRPVLSSSNLDLRFLDDHSLVRVTERVRNRVI